MQQTETENHINSSEGQVVANQQKDLRLQQSILEARQIATAESPTKVLNRQPLQDITTPLAASPLSRQVIDSSGNLQFLNSSTMIQAAEEEAIQLTQQEQQMQELQNKKRKRDEREQNEKQVKKKLKIEKKKIDEEERYTYTANTGLYSAFNDLQGISHDFNIEFNTPELVVVGMQSDGKSSFIEALLGFQFNIVDSNIGTRRPLIIQMINDSQKKKPSCRFKIDGQEGWENNETPVSELSDQIVKRTQAVAGSGDQIHSSPIFLRVEYCYCCNLNVYDTPGFRIGGDAEISEGIRNMVREIIEPQNRLIICLEQSTVEWSNTISRPLVREIDPEFERTVLINTKFDNRVKELQTSEQVTKYMTGEGLPDGVKPMFISLPLRRNLDSSEFGNSIKTAYLSDYKKLLRLGFDEEKFLPQLGFPKTKIHLENLLNEKYHQSLAPTLNILDNVCRKTKGELESVKKQLETKDLGNMALKAQQFVNAFLSQISKLLEGSIVGDPDKYGQTLNEEKNACGERDWPDFARFSFEIQNARFKVYGGSQYERLLNEFEFVTHSREFPAPSMNEVASSLGTSRTHNIPIFESAATDIVQNKAKQILQPLIDIVLSRTSYIMERFFDICVDTIKRENSDFGILTIYIDFITELRTAYFRFISETQDDCRRKLNEDFEAFTKIVDWDLLNTLNEIPDYNYTQVTPEETVERVNTIMNSKIGFSFDGNRSVTPETFEKVCQMSGKLFANLRFFFAKYIRNKLNAFFLDPMFHKLGNQLIDHFHKLKQDDYEKMFQLGIDELKAMEKKLEDQLKRCEANRDTFKIAYAQIKNQMSEVFQKRVNITQNTEK